MDLVTLTDHDSVSGAMTFAGRPDTFMSEEVTCTLPGGRIIHLGVFDLTERQHAGIAARRRDAEALFAYLAEQRLPACVNHIFSCLTGRREVIDYDQGLRGVPLVEGQNGMMPERTNALARWIARRNGRSLVGGSDAHTLASVASSYTVVPGARNRDEFLAGLRLGLTVPAGTSGSYARLTADVARVAAACVREAVRCTLDAPLGVIRLGLVLIAVPALAALPAVTAHLYQRELRFGRRQRAILNNALERAVEAVPVADEVAA
jgi:hypothetical protein